MNKKKSLAVVIGAVVLVLLLGFTTIVGFGPTGTGAARNILLGLDLSGGVSITYRAVGEEAPSAEDMSDTIYKLQQRVASYSTEAQVYQEGSDRINIEIPGVSDANAILEELGKPGSLTFELSDGTVVLEGTDVKTATAGTTPDEMGNSQNVVELVLTDEGSTKFAEATSENIGNIIYIVYDDQVISSPVVQTAITGGTAQITGMADHEEAERLASSIRIGSLSIELEELRSNVVGASLGQKAISTSLMAGIIGLILVILFMAVVYRVPGIVAGVSLLIYTGLDLLCLNAFDLTLTISGIAGIILSIGMAVDANVIIYARIREEIAAGASVKTAIKTGFQKALSAILDGNITTLIAAAVLAWKGTGSIQGFAQTLALGIVLSMFTACVVSRLIMNAVYTLGVQDEKYYGRAKQVKPIDFVGKRKIFFVISIVLVLSGPVAMLIHNGTDGRILNYSLEFMGGTATTVTFNEDYTIEELEEQVQPVIESVTGDANIQMQKVTGGNQVIIKTRELSVDERQEMEEKLVSDFGVDDTLISTESISSTISSEMRSDAVVAVLIATILMLLYIWFRFKDIRFATSAVIALLHDVLVVLACYAIVWISVGNTFIACMLTIVGYSINATIVIFDRIRENLKGMKKKDSIADVVNLSITQTLTRSIYTSITTFIMVAMLYVLGVSSIREFALPLMVGIICGGYSSVCITGPLWYVMKTKIKSKQ
ncbi:export membrane protein SecD [Marvinbryantia formatexigens DSM 14469]|uniref:Multifunctional fusion protein n=1 Tax=Marvinbryantia formatexigens DSM 14469 TaxID=478749 RepID=C6LAA6_9FIRM|nr:protein translocase subunit SecDF [Marvinbryantia formatexigens]EET62513.1 export membrane protein SecD [Marvinbryantia formatexigens DSM 14469]UWO24961.1 protein translocase subunit SecDF [Marvinbryantia formatexigens DSM 14469]SDG25442.1 SecD/SecF fusion protein [Marvinbryantia formatexigens]